MARSAEARALTEAQRISQNALAESTGRMVGRRYYRAARSVADIDALRSSWVADAVAQSQAAARKSQDRTRRYLTRYADAEGEELEVITPTLSEVSMAQTMTVSGPIMFKVGKSRGLSDDQALAYSRTRVSMAARNIVMGAGRDMTMQTARHNHERFRRVTDGKPCAFCAMLASRGPVYVSMDTADFRAHGACGCTAEIAFETPDEWVAQYATDEEVAWVNAYFDAAETASKAGQPRVAPVKGVRTQDTILHRMRRQHPDLFHDGVQPRH